MRLLSASANLGNGVVHAVLVVYIAANAGSSTAYWNKERELGGVGGPVILMACNALAGYFTLLDGKVPKLAVCWNVFVAVLGTLMPIVWPRFLTEGLSTWPYISIFLWFVIFAMELAALVASATWHLLAMASPRSRLE